MSSRLRQLRDRLTGNGFLEPLDLQRVYNFEFHSLNLDLFNVSVFVTSVIHPQVQFSNSGEYIGFISGYSKPADITISFLEDSNMDITKTLNYWEGLKFNKATGIFYPKEVYSDTARLSYFGPATLSPGNTKPTIPIHTYILQGFYPIQVDPISLSYGDNNILSINATFNVDDITPLEGVDITRTFVS